MKAPFGKPLVLLAILAVGVALGLIWYEHSALPWERTSEPGNAQSREFLPRRAQLEAREQEADRTVWTKEMLAEDCGRTIENLWDSINATSNKLERIAFFRVQEALLPEWGAVQHLPHGIELREGTGPGHRVSAEEWRNWIEEFERAGWQLENIEFRHNEFDPQTNRLPARSRFYFAANLTRARRPERAMLEGDLLVDWASKKPGEEFPAVARFDASHLTVKSRVGEPLFKRILQETITPPEGWRLIDPLIVYDLDGDGLPEIILAAKNLVYRRRGEGHYEAQPLCRFPLPFIMTAVIADFDGDGFADLLCATSKGLFLFKGSPQGRFDEPARLVWAANPLLQDAMVLTCGDIDGNGSLDVFLGQYKPPTLGQVLRPHYYDANDGFPSYLLRNDGHGNFTDVTGPAGLSPKRWRRIYSAALVDLDGDGHLDLSVISDFAGLDLYHNDGHGHFTDVTSQWVAEPHAFGMGQALADFNVDGRLDLLMIGMPSPTVDRLEHLDLHRPYSAEDRVRRPAMTYGNRLYVARSNGGFEQTALSASIARSGWSWGCSAFDFDNDGFPDVYVVNGLQSNRSVREYEGEFWLHSIFLDDIDDMTAMSYFMERYQQTIGSGWSYGGYEKNQLFLNQRGESFMDIGHLAGVALEQDCRNAVAADLDGDGRVDLVLTTLETWPEPKQTLQIYNNALGETGHWIGFRFHEHGGSPSPVGVSVTVTSGGRKATRGIVTGDSHRSQHPATIRFGLGESKGVESVEIRWPNGELLREEHPAIDRYQDIYGPKGSGFPVKALGPPARP